MPGCYSEKPGPCWLPGIKFPRFSDEEEACAAGADLIAPPFIRLAAW
jgi:hypothetical protein